MRVAINWEGRILATYNSTATSEMKHQYASMLQSLHAILVYSCTDSMALSATMIMMMIMMMTTTLISEHSGFASRKIASATTRLAKKLSSLAGSNTRHFAKQYAPRLNFIDGAVGFTNSNVHNHMHCRGLSLPANRGQYVSIWFLINK